MMKESVLKEKSFDFAVRITKFTRYLQEEKHEKVISKQILRSGTSVGANIWEATFAQSEADFISKLSISLKEAHETQYWLLLLEKSDTIDNKIALSLQTDLKELLAMLVASIKTIKKRIK